jgi:peptidoglycan hydrolase-like protein with peptidoglycan-binding domain
VEVQPGLWPTLKLGSVGAAVAEWQRVLLADGYDLGPSGADGQFGARTLDASRAWQKAHGLTADGIVGAGTRGAIKASRQLVVIGDTRFGASSPLPGLIRPTVPVEVMDPARSLAARTALHLMHSRPGREDKDLVRSLQLQEGVKPNGHYGPSTALALTRHGLVPPKPYYWSRTGTARIKRDYRAALRALAAQDPQRADEWTRAALVT